MREDPCFGRGVLGDAGMAIEMVGRKIEQHRNPRCKRVCRLQLEAAHFDHVNRVFR
jgi:hypothetical protein